ncbi:hypothetical protein ACJMK2_025103 [Sinanodonta woodiana]|uniref:Uncharacterized protein n=1 Tax=Sinanodonta woodiana TaxID=1069815 RepID=A0ABD3XFF3_SINWO
MIRDGLVVSEISFEEAVDLRGNRGRGRDEVARGGRKAFDEDRRGRGANCLRCGGRGSFKRGEKGWGHGLRRGRGDNLPITEEKQLNYQLDEHMSTYGANQD